MKQYKYNKAGRIIFDINYNAKTTDFSSEVIKKELLKLHKYNTEVLECAKADTTKLNISFNIKNHNT